jgi:hypothetical protein
MAGLVPAISIRDMLCDPKWDARDKPVHDDSTIQLGAMIMQ